MQIDEQEPSYSSIVGKAFLGAESFLSGGSSKGKSYFLGSTVSPQVRVNEFNMNDLKSKK